MVIICTAYCGIKTLLVVPTELVYVLHIMLSELVAIMFLSDVNFFFVVERNFFFEEGSYFKTLFRRTSGFEVLKGGLYEMQKHFFPLDGRDLKVALIHQLLLVYFKGVRIECGKRDSCIMEQCSWL